MFALIYDEHDLNKPFKEVISVHKTRETAEKALEKRKLRLGKTTVECNTRIVWVKHAVKRGNYLTVAEFENWRPGEKIPEGELVSDTD